MNEWMHACMQSEDIKFGPWGGNGGTTCDTSETQGINEIKIYHGNAIYGLIITYFINGEPQTLSVGDTRGELKQVRSYVRGNQLITI